MLTPVTFEQFGGLDLARDPFEIGAGGAVDLLNVFVDRPGVLRTRYGLDEVTSAVTNANHFLQYQKVGVDQLIAVDWDGGNIYVRDTSTGASVTTGAFFASGVVATGGSTEAVYFPSNAGLYKWTGSGTITLAVTSSEAKGTFGALWQGRLVTTRTDGGTHRSRVQFSDPGAPETFGVNNWIDLDPGDGDAIRALVTWRELLFVFKRRKFWVFYGISTDADGEPIFNQRAVDAKVGTPAAEWSNTPHAVAGLDGVYFIGQDGIYRTQGDTPAKVSGVLDPWLKGEAVAGLNSDLLAFSPQGLHYSRGRVFFSLAGEDPTLVYDIASGTWTIYDLSIRAAADYDDLGATKSLLVTDTGIHRHAHNYEADNDVPIPWRYKSGKYALADPGTVAVTTESSLVGSGTVSLRLDSDIYTNQNGSVTLGTYPAVAEGWPANVDQEGRWLQFTLSGTGRATVSQLKHYLSSKKPVGVG